MSSFTEELEVTPLSNSKDWKLLKPFDYHVGSLESDQVVTVPAGFVTDFASIPGLLIAILGLLGIAAGHYWGIIWLLLLGILAVLAAASLPRWGKYGKAAIIHDWLYHTKQLSRRMSDLIFLEGMEILSVGYIERTAMYRAVRWVGWLAWRRRR